jgi:hypothetical protein
MVLESHYPGAQGAITRAKEVVGDKRVVSVKSMDDSCAESYPCRGHGGVVITFERQHDKLQLRQRGDWSHHEVLYLRVLSSRTLAGT